MKKRAAIALAASMALGACMSQADLSAIESAVAQFHERQERAEDQTIYDAAAPGFRSAATLQDLTRLNSAVRGASGCDQPTRDPMQWNNNINTSGHFTTVVYNRQCSGGPLTETFVFQIQNQQPLLLNYNVGGMALFPGAPPAPAPSQEPAPSAEPTPSDKPA